MDAPFSAEDTCLCEGNAEEKWTLQQGRLRMMWLFFTDIATKIVHSMVKLLLTNEMHNVKIMFVILGSFGPMKRKI